MSVPCSTSLKSRRLWSLVAAGLIAGGAGLVAGSAEAQIVLKAHADAEIREDQPELARGAGAAGTTGPVTELAIRVTAGQNRAAVVRFDLTGLTAADMMGFADLRLFSRNANLGGTNAGGIKIYGINPTAPLAGTWDEQTVHYRDAGTSEPINPVGAHPRSQPNPGHPSLGDPLPPVYVSSPPTWGSNPNAATRAPGLRHENPPYSMAAEQTNSTRYTNNQAIRAAYLADPTGTYNYEFYVDQPGYMTASASASHPDLFDYDVPGSTVANDIDPSLTRFLGFLNYDAKNPARPAGTVFSFTTELENSPVNMGPDEYLANRAELVNFLTSALNGGHTSASFLIFQKNPTDMDPLPVRSDNLIFASKDFVPAGFNVGDWAPQLVLAPEPGSLSLLALSGLTLLRRRR